MRQSPVRAHGFTRRILVTLLKWACLLGLFYWVITTIDITEIRDGISNIPFQTVLLFLALMLLARIVYSTRWQRIFRSIGLPALPVLYLLRLNLLSEFVSIVLPSYLGGDGARLLKLAEHTEKKRDAFIAILLDRVVGLTTLILLTLIFSPFLTSLIAFNIPPWLWLLGSAGSLLAAWLFFRLLKPLRWPVFAQLQLVRANLPRLAEAFVLSLVGHMIFAGGYYLLFREMVSIDPGPIIAITLLSSLTRSVPISVLGIEVSDGSLLALSQLLKLRPVVGLAVVAISIIARYLFALSGLLIELLADGRHLFNIKNPVAEPLISD
jgi:uncharacterized membrane protein YbhN (UPF0104 family)